MGMGYSELDLGQYCILVVSGERIERTAAACPRFMVERRESCLIDIVHINSGRVAVDKAGKSYSETTDFADADGYSSAGIIRSMAAINVDSRSGVSFHNVTVVTVQFGETNHTSSRLTDCFRGHNTEKQAYRCQLRK